MTVLVAPVLVWWERRTAVVAVWERRAAIRGRPRRRGRMTIRIAPVVARRKRWVAVSIVW